MTSLDQIVTANVRVAMDHHGISQGALADRTGISERTLKRRLTGGSFWLAWEIGVIAGEVNVAPSELLRADFGYSDQGDSAAERDE